MEQKEELASLDTLDGPSRPSDYSVPLEPKKFRNLRRAYRTHQALLLFLVTVALLIFGYGTWTLISQLMNNNTPKGSTSTGQNSTDRIVVLLPGKDQVLTVNSQLQVNNLTTINSDLRVNGSSSLQGVTVNGDLSLKGNLLAAKNGIFIGNVSANNISANMISGNFVGSYSGNGSALDNVNAITLNGHPDSYYTNASNLSSGTLSDSRLSTNVALLNQPDVFSQDMTLQGNLSGQSAIFSNSVSALIFTQNGRAVCDSSGNCAGSGGGITGAGTTNTIALFTGNGTIGDSLLSQTGTIVNVNGTLSATALQGSGSTITNLDASNLASGTVASGRLGGSYGGVTGTGALTSGSIASGFGTISTTNGITTTAAIQGGTLANTGSSFAVNSSGNITTALSSTTGATLVCQNASSQLSTCTNSYETTTGTDFIKNQTSQQTSANLNIQARAASVAATIQGAAGSDIIDFVSSGATTVAKLDSSGNLTAVNGIFTGNVTAATGLTVTAGGATITAGGLTVSAGASSFGGNVSITGTNTLTVGTGATTLGGTLGVTGAVTLSNLGLGVVQSSAAGLLSSGTVNLASSSYVSGLLGIANGGTGSGTAAGARTNLGAAASGANSDITSLSGLTTALSVAQGGTGINTLATNGILYGNGTGAIQATAAAANSILATDGSNIPSLTQTLPTAVQGNITTTGALTSGSIASGFGTISTTNGITTTAAIQGGTLANTGSSFAVNSSGNITTALSSTTGATLVCQNASSQLSTCTNSYETTTGTDFIQNTTTQQSNANFNIHAAVGTVAATIRGAANQDVLDLVNNAGTGIASFDQSGDLTASGFGHFTRNSAVNGSGVSISATNTNNTATSITSNGFGVSLTGTTNTNANANTLNGINFSNVTAIANNTFNGLNFGTGYNSLLNYNGTQLISGSGILQNAALSNAIQYTNITGVGALSSGSIASGFGTISTTNGITTTAAIQGGTLANTGSSFAVNSSGNITTALSSTTGATLVCQNASSQLSTCTNSYETTTGTDFIKNQTSQQTSANLNIQARAASVAATIQGAAGSDIIDFVSSGATTVAKLDSSGNLTAVNGIFTGNVTAATGLTVTAGGATITAGGLTVSAGGANITGNINTTGNYQIGGNVILQNPGTYNIFVGQNSGNLTTTGANNTGLGSYTLTLNTSGASNTATGYGALYSNSTGSNNTASGWDSLVANTTGSYNVASGYQSLVSNTSGGNNVALGYEALGGNTFGATNVAVGNYAGNANSGGASNTLIGSGADVATGNLQFATAIGNNAFVGASNSLVLGEVNGLHSATANTNVGIGTITPTNTLSVSPQAYNTGTATQSTTTITGTGTTFTAAMVGDQLTFANGDTETITGFTSATSLTVSVSKTEASQAYSINYQGLQVTSTGNTLLGGTLAVTGLSTLSGGASITKSSGVALVVQGASGQDITDFKTNGGSNAAYIDQYGSLTASSFFTTAGANNGGVNNQAINVGYQNTNTSASNVTVNGLKVALTGSVDNNGNKNTNNAVNLANVTATTGNVFNGIYFGTGYDNLLNYNGTQLISGSGILQNAALSNAIQYTNITGVGALSSGSIASGFGTISTTNGITTTAAIQGGTLANTGSSFAVNSSGNITTALSSTTGATLVCQNASSQLSTCTNSYETTTGTDFIKNQTSQQTSANLNIQARAASVAATIQGAAGSDIIDFVSSGATTVAKLDASGNLTAVNGIFTGNVTAATGLTVTAGGATITAGGLTVSAGASSFGGNVSITGTNTLTVGTGATTLGGTLTANGATLLQDTTNSVTALQVLQSTGGASVLDVDTINQRIGIGTAAPGFSLDDQAGGINTAYNYYIGGSLALSTAGTNNLSVGNGTTPSGSANTYLGTNSGSANTTGHDNSALGLNSLKNNLGGYNNAAIGEGVLQGNTSGYSNSGLGFQSLNVNTSGVQNTGLGSGALAANTTANQSTAVGYGSLQASTTGNGNTAVGTFGLSRNTTGTYNTALGYDAGNKDNNGNYQTPATIQNSTAIGAYAQVQASNSLVLGSVDIATKIGIGTTVPLNTFSVSAADLNSTSVTASQSSGSGTITASAAIFSAANVGEEFIWLDGTQETITGYTNSTVVTGSSTTTTETTQYFRTHYMGLQVMSSGNVCIGVVTCSEALGVSGSAKASGGFTTGTPDIAEYIVTTPDVTAFDVVAADPNNNEQVVKSSAPYQSSALGIISDGTSGFMMENAHYGQAFNTLTNTPDPSAQPMALAGRLLVHVTNEGGAIKPGDYLTTSSTSGYAMKATHAGPTVGKALGSFNAASGTVLVLVNISYYYPDTSQNIQANNATLNSLTVNGAMQAANINIGDLATLGSLQVTGSATIDGNLSIAGGLTVTGMTSVADITVSGHIITAGNAPNVQPAINAGSGATVSIDGNDNAGTITLSTGKQSTQNGQTTGVNPVVGDMATITFNKAYGKTPRIILTPNDGKSAPLLIYPDQQSTTSFSFALSNLPAAATTYTFEYFIVQ